MVVVRVQEVLASCSDEQSVLCKPKTQTTMTRNIKYIINYINNYDLKSWVENGGITNRIK
jgi:hypothetical protein